MGLWPQLTETKKLVSKILYIKPRISIMGFLASKNAGTTNIIHPHHDVCLFVKEGELTLHLFFPEQTIILQKKSSVIVKAGSIYGFTALEETKFIRIILGQDAESPETLTRRAFHPMHWRFLRFREKMHGWISDNYLALCAESIKITFRFQQIPQNQFGQFEESLEVNSISYISPGLRQIPIQVLK